MQLPPSTKTFDGANNNNPHVFVFDFDDSFSFCLLLAAPVYPKVDQHHGHVHTFLFYHRIPISTKYVNNYSL